MHGSVFALLLTALAVVLSVLMRRSLGPDAFLPYIAAIGLSAWYYGRTGGLAATAFATLAFLYYFFGSGLYREPAAVSLLRILSFIVLGIFITWLTASWQDSRRLLASTLSSIGDAVLATDKEGRITFMNPVAETLTGWTAREARGQTVQRVMRLIDVAGRQPIENPLTQALRRRVMVTLPDGHLLLSRSGAEAAIEQTASPIREDSGGVRGGILVFRDTSRRRQLEEQITHARKMEAVGRLAGGVAGDFNNVLTVISGYAGLLRSEISSANPLRRFVDEIFYGSERAVALTRHLLAFSRGTGANPRLLDLNSAIHGLEPILRRLLGQHSELILLPGSALGRVNADPSQIEQVILNLASNARDAMPEGGKLVIETSNVELEAANARNLGLPPGRYVMLAVSDTGCGMDAATRSRLFEPLFTTKDPGKGSGLGLAVVYGIVKQSEGQITVYSQPGCGTIFEIYLPRLLEADTRPVTQIPPKGSETILIVDDEDGVRQLLCAVLKSQGYDVLEAADAAAALGVYQENSSRIDMVLTDVVMPHTTGFELGRELAARAPGLKVLYMSGYRDSAPSVDGEPAPPFLHKPFSPDVLLSKVREVLDAA